MFAALFLALAPFAGAGQEMVIIREGGREYHWPGCPVVRDAKDVLAMTRAQANGRGLKPHADCDPSQTPGEGAAAKPIFVFLDEGKFYHREKCARLGPSPRKVNVNEAARKHWPCRTCKPPIRPRNSPRDRQAAAPAYRQ